MGFKLRVPDTLVLLFAIMVLAWAATWVLPQGSFETVDDGKGHALVVPGTFTLAEQRVNLSPLSLLTVVPRALAAAQDIIFFVLIAGGMISVLRGTGMIDAVLGSALRRIGHSPGLMIGCGLTLFAVGSSTLGMSEEYIPLTALLVGLCLAMRMDALVAVGIITFGSAVGYATAALNPFTLMIAQSIAGLSPTSGMPFRLALFVPLLAIAFHHLYRYSNQVAKDPAASLMAGLPARQRAPTEFPGLDRRRLAVLLLAIAALPLLVWGIMARGWYMVEMGALFLGVALLSGVVGGLGADGTARRFAEGAAELAGTALLIGFARAISLILADGQVLHTIVNGLSGPLNMLGAHAAAVGMLLVQAAINFLIPSGSGQAFVTMPIMAPLGDLVGVSRQSSVLAYQLGDGLANMVVPTSVVLMSMLGIAGIPYGRWIRFAWPLFLKLMAAAAVAMLVAVSIGYA